MKQIDLLSEFTQQLSQISANVLARQRWDGLDPMTGYQDLEILVGYTIQRSYLRFNLVYNQAYLMPVTELEARSLIQLE